MAETYRLGLYLGHHRTSLCGRSKSRQGLFCVFVGSIQDWAPKYSSHLIYMGEQPYDMFCFNYHDNRKELDESLHHSTCEGCKKQTRATAATLMNVVNHQLNAGCGWRGVKSQTVVLLLTGGPASDAADLKAAGDALRPTAKLVIVGVGPETTQIKSEADVITGGDYVVNFFFPLSSWSDLSVTRPRIYHAVRKLKCNKKIDLTLIVDRSGSIDVFGKIKIFLRKMMKEFQIGPDRTRVSVIIYALEVYKKFCFNKAGVNDNANSLDNELAAINCPGRCKDWSTKTSKALKSGTYDMITAACGIRKDAKQITLHFSDGESSEDMVTVQKAADELRKKGPIIAVGVGDILMGSRGKEELEGIASVNKGQKMFHVIDDFDVLENVDRIIAKQVCEIA